MEDTTAVKYRVLGFVAVVAILAGLTPKVMQYAGNNHELQLALAQKEQEVEMLRRVCPLTRSASTPLAYQASTIAPPKTFLSHEHMGLVPAKAKNQPPKAPPAPAPHPPKPPTLQAPADEPLIDLRNPPLRNMPLEPKDAIKHVDQPKPLQSVAPVAVRLPKKPATIVTPKPQWVAPHDRSVTIRVASFSRQEGAQQLVAQLQSIGLNASTEKAYQSGSGRTITRVMIRDEMNALQARQLLAELYDRYRIHALIVRG